MNTLHHKIIWNQLRKMVKLIQKLLNTRQQVLVYFFSSFDMIWWTQILASGSTGVGPPFQLIWHDLVNTNISKWVNRRWSTFSAHLTRFGEHKYYQVGQQALAHLFSSFDQIWWTQILASGSTDVGPPFQLIWHDLVHKYYKARQHALAHLFSSFDMIWWTQRLGISNNFSYGFFRNR